MELEGECSDVMKDKFLDLGTVNLKVIKKI